MIKVTAASNLTQRTFINDGIKAWNLAPQGIKESQTLEKAKSEIKKLIKLIPI